MHPLAHADDIFISTDEAKAVHGQKSTLFVGADSQKDFEKSHIPLSQNAYSHDLTYLDDVRKCQGLPMCKERAFNFIGKNLGIDQNHQVIVYDSGIGVNASGLWFFLKLYGHKNVKIMDGGLATWTAKGLPTETGSAKKAIPKTFIGEIQSSMMATKEEVEGATKNQKEYLILDARHTFEEYTGKELQTGLVSLGKEISVARGGHIPSAVFSPWTKYSANKNGEAGKTILKNPEDLKKQTEKLKKNGYDENKIVISYCHVGLGRGTFQYLALQKAGHQKAKVYVGSWHEWGNTPTLPLGKDEGLQE